MDWQTTLEVKGILEDEVKRRSMIYQYARKCEIAKIAKVGFSTFFYISADDYFKLSKYAEWQHMRAVEEALKVDLPRDKSPQTSVTYNQKVHEFFVSSLYDLKPKSLRRFVKKAIAKNQKRLKRFTP